VVTLGDVLAYMWAVEGGCPTLAAVEQLNLIEFGERPKEVESH